MPSKPVKLSFDLKYPDHEKAYYILKSQKQTTQFVVNLILGQSVGKVTEEDVEKQIQINSLAKANKKIPVSNLQVSDVFEKSVSLQEIPSGVLSFLED